MLRCSVTGGGYEDHAPKEMPKKAGVSYSSYNPDEYSSSKTETITKTSTVEKSSPLKSPGVKKGGGIEDDPDKPKNAVSTKITKNISIKNGKKTTIEKKVYTLDDGSQQIIENETIEEER